MVKLKWKKGKGISLIPLFMVSVLNLVHLGSSFAEAETFKGRLTIASGSPWGYHLTPARVLANILNEELVGIQAIVEVTKGPIENSFLIGMGKTDLAFVDGRAAYEAVSGIGIFKDDRQPLAALLAFYPELEYIVATKKSGIRSVRELKGKRVAVGLTGTYGSEIASIILDAHGLLRKVNKAYLDPISKMHALRAGTVDAAFIYAPYLCTELLELSGFRGIRLISLENKFLEKIQREFPGYMKFRIPPGAYAGVNSETLCVANPGLLVTRKDTDEQVAYAIVNTMIRSARERKYPELESLLEIERAGKSPIPLHPGASKAFRMHGMEVE